VLLTYILAFFTVISLVLTVWQWLVASSFPLHERAANTSFAPGISLLKPLKGFDSRTAECLRSWCEQDYAGPVQILFGVESAEDPVCSLVREIMGAFPQLDAQLVLCPEKHGANAKVSTLIQLQPVAKYEFILVSDADVHAPPDLLKEVLQPLTDSSVGLVTCFYRLTNKSNLGMRWEAFAINADFWSQVLQAQSLKPLDFAMGAVMVTRKADLERIGGLASLEDFLADDYQLGNKIARAGARVVLNPVVVECRSATLQWQDVWAHQKRWARTIRVSQPIPYFFSKLSNATFWPLLWVLCDPGARSSFFGAFCLLVRMGQACYCEGKLTSKARLSSLWMAPLKDMLQLAIWILAFTGNRIRWRGRDFAVQPSGKLIRLR
jgi:ceramide glucosyltransferase